MHRSDLKRFIWYASLYSGTAALLKLAGFVLFLWFARTLSVDGYASFGLLYAVQSGIIMLSIGGIFEAVVGLLRERREAAERQALYTSANRLFVLAAFAVSVFAVLVFGLFAKPTRVGLFGLASVLASGALLAFASLQAQMARLEEKHLASVLFSFAAPLAGLVGGFLAFFVERTPESFFSGSMVGAALALVSLWRRREGAFGAVDGAIKIRIVALAGAPFAGVAVLSWLGGYGNNYVIHTLFEPVEVARFTFALSIISIMLLVAGGLNQVWSPRFYRITHEEPFEEVERKNRLFFGVLAVVLGIVAAAVVVVLPTTTRAIGGNLLAYQSMSLELTLMLGSYIALSPAWHCQNYFFAYARGPELMKIMLLTSIVGIAVWIALMLMLGPIGVYLGFMIQTLLRTVGIVVGAKKHWPVTISWAGVAVGLLITLVGFAATTFMNNAN